MLPPRLAAALALIGALGAAAAQPAHAQLVSSMEAGGTSIDYDDQPLNALFVLTPSVSRISAHSLFTATGSLATTDLAGVASRGTVRGMVFAPALGALRLEAGAVSGWDAFRAGATTGWWRGELRARYDRARAGTWLAAGAGRELDGESWHPAGSLGAGAWARVGGVTLSASLTSARAWGINSYKLSTTHHTIYDTLQIPGSTDSVVQFDSTSVDTSLVRGAVGNTDAEAALRWTRGALGVELAVGRRVVGGAGSTPWANAQAMLWLSDRLALVAAGGRIPSSLVEGHPAARYMTFALHYARRPAPAARAVARARPGGRGRGGSRAPGVVEGDATNGKRTIAVQLPEAHQVEIMGDFTDWTPVALTRGTAGAWSATLAIPPGAHRMNVRIDGGAWRVPPGLASVNDDFNGLTGLLIVR